MSSHCTFDEALPRAVKLLKERFSETDIADVRFIRDMNGRLFVVLPDAVEQSALDAARPLLVDALGVYSPGSEGGLARYCDTLAGQALLEEPVLIQYAMDRPARMIERRVVGQDWAKGPEPNQQQGHPPRVAFFSLKGGVGRSTALFFWGRRLATSGKTVLLLDLDLEAPGLGAQLLPDEDRSDYGVLDWLVEDLLDNPAAEEMLDRMLAQSPLSSSPGLWVVPATGRITNDHPGGFIAKLARAYLESSEQDGGASLAGRVRRLVELLEGRLNPDATLIDSRAGLHESSAGAILHLDADVLLFATDQPTVWEGYRFLLSQLAQMAHFRPVHMDDDWRLRLKMVHARAAQTQAASDRFLSNAYQVWLDALYDEAPPEETSEPTAASELFTFAQNEEAAPHYPLTILSDPRFEGFNPLEDLNEEAEAAVNATFGPFVESLDQRIFGEADAV
jgi:MinD-like ATPase involved in chromosome partitioning or flagellar assembly